MIAICELRVKLFRDLFDSCLHRKIIALRVTEVFEGSINIVDATFEDITKSDLLRIVSLRGSFY